jgi:uncharacterized protein
MLVTSSRREFLRRASVAAAALAAPHIWIPRAFAAEPTKPLEQFDYADVTLDSDLHEKQLRETHAVLMDLSEDSLLKPFRQMTGQPAPGEDLGGWYHYEPGPLPDDGFGFAPAAPFGQWVSALARMSAILNSQETRDKVIRLNRLYAQTISGDFYHNNRFPTYCYDKLVLGLIDSRRLAGDRDAFAILEQTTNTALPHFAGHAVEHGVEWRTDHTGDDWTSDESYTISENLFLAYQQGAGDRYRELGRQYLDDVYYDPLARGESNLNGRHAYSYINSLSSAMQAYLTLGSEKHFRAARNAFDMIEEQSFATGGWGPDETLRAPGSDDLYDSLTKTHHSFETPCGAYAHFKLTRYLLRVTRDPRYGDSMERLMYNTVLGAKPLLPDGSAFYYSDYNFHGSKFYHQSQWARSQWPCCAGTLPQVAADYRLNSYFRDADGIYVNLYVPSSVRWTQNGAQLSLKQTSNYPFASEVALEVKASGKSEFAIKLRIPAWAEGASVAINGKPIKEAVTAGRFATVRRHWKSGDRIEVDLPMRPRLEAINPRHSDTVALLNGPLVLFATGTTPSSVKKEELLAVKRVGPQEWEAQTSKGTILLLPFTAITDEPYTTYLKLS